METISIVIPAYNEERRIGKTLKEYYAFFKEKKLKKEIKDFQLLVVINNTNDKTEEVVKKFQREKSEVGYLNFKRGGKGFAVLEGFRDSLAGDWSLIGFSDADLATDPKEFYKLLKNIGKKDGVISSRYIKEAVISKKQPLKRILISRFGNFIIRSLFLMPYRDTQCGAKIFRRNAAKLITEKVVISQWAFDVELLYHLRKNNFKIIEFPIRWNDVEESKFDVRKASLQMFFAIIQLRAKNSPFKKLLKQLKSPMGYLWRKLR